jgi:hypothetical protein
LLIISFLVLGYLTLHTYINFLTAFILVIVYVGAIIVLIGYICAIRHNLVLEPNYNVVYLFLFLLPFIFVFSYSNIFIFELNSSTIVDYFYSYQGVSMFFVLVTILFITLLIVTSQYSVPQGPFRSVKV